MENQTGKKGNGKLPKNGKASLKKAAEDLGTTSQLAREGVETIKKATAGVISRGKKAGQLKGEEKKERKEALLTYRQIIRALANLAENCEASRSALVEANSWLEKWGDGDHPEDQPKAGPPEGLEQLKQRFLQRLGHDLRTPLTSIKGSQDLLKSGVVGKLSQEAIEMVDITERNTNRLITLVDQIMELEKTGMGQQGMKKTHCSLEGILRRALTELVTNLTGGHADVSIYSRLAPLYGNEETLVHIVGDLLVYALKIPPSPGKVVVWTEETPQGVKVCIRAQGKRIPPDTLERIFDPFNEGIGNEDSHHFSGTGLEMAVCRAIVAEHSGTIGVDNHPEGCVFWFVLPREGPGRD
jgi:signal transduction histidine kinase